MSNRSQKTNTANHFRNNAMVGIAHLTPCRRRVPAFSSLAIEFAPRSQRVNRLPAAPEFRSSDRNLNLHRTRLERRETFRQLFSRPAHRNLAAHPLICLDCAEVAESADARDSKSRAL